MQSCLSMGYFQYKKYLQPRQCMRSKIYVCSSGALSAMWQWTMNWLHCGGIFDEIGILLHECQTLRSYNSSLKKISLPYQVCDNQSIRLSEQFSRKSHFSPFGDFNTFLLCFLLCLYLEFVGNPFFMVLSVTFDEICKQWH